MTEPSPRALLIAAMIEIELLEQAQASGHYIQFPRDDGVDLDGQPLKTSLIDGHFDLLKLAQRIDEALYNA